MNIDTDVTMNFFSVKENRELFLNFYSCPYRSVDLCAIVPIRSAAFEGMCPEMLLPRCYSIIIVQWRQAVLA